MGFLGAQQPYFLPDFYYFFKIFNSDQFIFADHLSFRKQSGMVRTPLINRQPVKYLSIPVIHQSIPHPPLRSVELLNSTDWRRKHLKTVQSLFRQTPFFEYYFPGLKGIYEKKHQYLVSFLLDLMFWQLRYIFPEKKILVGSEAGINKNDDLLQLINNLKNPCWIVYREEEKYYQDKFANIPRKLLKLPAKIKFPDNYHPSSPLLFLLFYSGPETSLFFNGILSQI